MATLQASLVAVGEGEVEIVMPFSTALTQQHGFTHAGALTTIVDTAGGFAVLTMIPVDAAVLTSEFKVIFMSPARGE